MIQYRHEFLRYGLIIVFGLVIDLSVARGAIGLGAPMVFAAALGVACGAVFNYVLLQLWAFRGPKIAVATQPLRYLGALGFSMAVRSGAVWVLQAILPADTSPMTVLGGGVAVSFATNFLLSKYWVFRRAGTLAPTPGD